MTLRGKENTYKFFRDIHELDLTGFLCKLQVSLYNENLGSTPIGRRAGRKSKEQAKLASLVARSNDHMSRVTCSPPPTPGPYQMQKPVMISNHTGLHLERLVDRFIA